MMRKLIHHFIQHTVITNWVMLVVGLAGVFALFNMNKRISPKLTRPRAARRHSVPR